MPVTPRRPLLEVLDEFGLSNMARRFPPHRLRAIAGELPDAMVDFWIEHGRGQRRNGLDGSPDFGPTRRSSLSTARRLFASVTRRPMVAVS